MVFLVPYFLRWSAFLSLFRIFRSMVCAGLFPDPFCVPYSVVEDEKFSVTSNPCFTDHFFSPFIYFYLFFFTHYGLAFRTYWIPWSWCCTACLEGYTGSADESVHLLPLKANTVFLFFPFRGIELNFSRFCLPLTRFTCAAGVMYLLSLSACD